MASASLEAGYCVRLVGLTGNLELNGAEGIILGPPEGSPARYPVKLLRPPTIARAHPAGVKVKSDNLQALQQQTAQPSSSSGSTSASPAGPASAARPAAGGPPNAGDSAGGGGGRLDPAARAQMASERALQFIDAVDADMYPDELIERMFGVQMYPQSGKDSSDLGTWPMGNLTFGAWITIRNMHAESKAQLYGVYELDYDEEGMRQQGEIYERIRQDLIDEIAGAIVEGRLPQWYKEQLEALRASGQASQYVCEILRRGCRGIPWDMQMLGRLAGTI